MEKVRLGDVCIRIVDGSHNPPEGILHSEYLMISSKNIEDGVITKKDPRFLSKEDFLRENERTGIRPGDLLMTIVGTVGRAAIVPENFGNVCLQRSVAILRPDSDRIIPYYLMYQLQALRKDLENESHGVAQKGLYLKQIESIQVCLPPISVQREIVAKLDAVCDLIAKRKEQIESLHALAKSKFTEMFGDQSDNSTIGEACELINGCAFKPTDWNDTGIPIVRIQNLNDPNIPFNFYAGIVAEKFMIDSGELLFSWSGTPGTSFGAFVWNRGKAVLNQHIFKVLPKFGMDKIYLRAALDYNLPKIIEKAHGGVGLRHITKGDLERINLLIPPLPLQQKFADFVAKLDATEAGLKKSLGELEALKKSMMQEFFG